MQLFWSGTNDKRWSMFVPPGSTAATYPALPPAMDSLVPAMQFVAVSVTAAESPNDGIEDLFGFEWIDRMLVTGPSTPQP